jgi:hypothetical protein
MASTIERSIVIRNNTKKLVVPIKSGETIYHGCVGIVKTTGYGYNHVSTVKDMNGIQYVGIWADETVNTTGLPAATTADGSITGVGETKSAVAGDRTVRVMYLDGQMNITMTGLTQADLGKVVFASDNYTFSLTEVGLPVGRISKVLSATLAELNINEFGGMKYIPKSGESFPITLDITTGSASEAIYTADAPFAFEIVDVIVQPRGASTNGTMKLNDGTHDITNAMVAAVDATIARAGTIDNTYSTIAVGGSLVVVCAGDTVGNTIGLVTILAIRS